MLPLMTVGVRHRQVDPDATPVAVIDRHDHRRTLDPDPTGAEPGPGRPAPDLVGLRAAGAPAADDHHHVAVAAAAAEVAGRAGRLDSCLALPVEVESEHVIEPAAAVGVVAEECETRSVDTAADAPVGIGMRHHHRRVGW